MDIFGAGHISKSLSKVATLAGFNSVVIDNRDTFANRERFVRLAHFTGQPAMDAHVAPQRAACKTEATPFGHSRPISHRPSSSE